MVTYIKIQVKFYFDHFTSKSYGPLKIRRKKNRFFQEGILIYLLYTSVFCNVITNNKILFNFDIDCDSFFLRVMSLENVKCSKILHFTIMFWITLFNQWYTCLMSMLLFIITKVFLCCKAVFILSNKVWSCDGSNLTHVFDNFKGCRKF